MGAETENQLAALGRKMNWLSIALALAGGAVMRLWMLKDLPQIETDTLLYGSMAKNLLQHGQFAITGSDGVVHETLIRLPGYPLFLAACFKLFGVSNYTAVSYVQIALELAGCLLLAAFVRRIAPPAIREGAAHWTLWLSALCPFTAAYAVAPLTETPTLFAIALALWALARFHARPDWGNALWFTLAITLAALLRPDGALLGVALAPALVLGLRRSAGEQASGAKAHVDSAGAGVGAKAPTYQVPTYQAPVYQPRAAALVRMGTVCVLLALLPFGIWTARNWRVFHLLEPLAPRYATDPGEPINPGWQRWMKTWCLDFVSTYDIYWNVPGNPLDLNKLPSRAFDSPAQRAETVAIAAAYDDNGQDLSPELDARFAQLAEERVKAHPLRYYLWLPLGRMADMWLRPRVENLNIDLDWWVYSHHYAETRFSWAYAVLNAVYLLLALAGLCFRPRYWQCMLLYLVLRSALLTTIEAPEARYTLECFPMVFALAGIGLYGSYRKIVGAFARRKKLSSLHAQ
jgi:hypothetical protein